MRVRKGKEIQRLINCMVKDRLDRAILRAIVKLGGRARFVDLAPQLVRKTMAKLTLQRHLKKLITSGLVTREPGEHKGKPTFYYRFGPRLSPDLLDRVDHDLIKLAYRAAHDLEVKAKTDEQRRKVIERAVEDTFKLQRGFTLRAIARCLQESDERKMVRAFLWLMDNITTPAATQLMAFCHTYPEVAGSVIERLAEEAGKEEVQILEFKPRPKKAHRAGRR